MNLASFFSTSAQSSTPVVNKTFQNLIEFLTKNNITNVTLASMTTKSGQKVCFLDSNFGRVFLASTVKPDIDWLAQNANNLQVVSSFDSDRGYYIHQIVNKTVTQTLAAVNLLEKIQKNASTDTSTESLK